MIEETGGTGEQRLVHFTQEQLRRDLIARYITKWILSTYLSGDCRYLVGDLS